MCDERFAERGGVERHQASHLECLQSAIRTEYVMDDQGKALVKRADPDALIGLVGQGISPGLRAAARLISVEVARADR
jgi:hypothetical protein